MVRKKNSKETEAQICEIPFAKLHSFRVAKINLKPKIDTCLLQIRMSDTHTDMCTHLYSIGVTKCHSEISISL